MKLRLHNTASRTVEELQPIVLGEVRLYTCGPTVYWDATIGNFRSFIFEDVLVRVLNHAGYAVRRVMNITDVGHLTDDGDQGEDKLEVGARREGVTAWDVARRYEARFLSDMETLRVVPPDQLVRATETISQQIDLILRLEAMGFVYRIDDGMYFEAAKFSDYGKMAHLDLEGQQAGARIELNVQKRGPHDFALWKFSPPDAKRDMEWDSPWGLGFPGWHIECSAIAMTYLGNQIDIHCGGIDHIPVHHTNEIAQTEAATGQKPFARLWVHNDFLLVDGGKMSKSLGNGYTLADLQQRGIHPLAFRYFLYGAVYRAKLNFTWESVQAAQTAWERLRGQVQALGATEEVTDISTIEDALTDDLNTPQALVAFREIMKSDRKDSEKRFAAAKFDSLLALGLTDLVNEESLPDDVSSLLEQRNAARTARNFALSDLLREKLEAVGYTVEDRADKSVLTKIK